MENNFIPPKLRSELEAVINTGDEAKFRQFITDHMQEFPQEVQDEIIVALVEEALQQDSSAKIAAAFRHRGLMALNILGKAKQELEKQKKLNEIKRSI
jgi:hypothetical protein